MRRRKPCKTGCMEMEGSYEANKGDWNYCPWCGVELELEDE